MPLPSGIYILRQQKVEDELIERIKVRGTSTLRVALDSAEIRAAERLVEYGKISLNCRNMDCHNYAHRTIAKRFIERGFILEKRKHGRNVRYCLTPFPPKEQQDG